MKYFSDHYLIGLVGSILLLPVWSHAQKTPRLLSRSIQKSVWKGGLHESILVPKGPRVVMPPFPASLERALATAVSRQQWVELPGRSYTEDYFRLAEPVARTPIRFLHQPPLRQQVPFPGKEQIDAVIFDMDGTLLDSLPAWKNSASNFLRSQGIEPPEGLDAEMGKLSLMDGAKIIKERYGFSQSAEEILEMTLAPIVQHYLTDIQAKPGALLLLKDLHSRGIKISVATASDKQLAQHAFERLGMMPYVDFIITCDEVGVGKRSSAVYDAAREHMGTRKERTLVVEDALYALQTAKKAGYLTAGVAEPFHSLEHEIAVSVEGDFFIVSYLTNTVFIR